jgi:arylsulfatase A-like enzyme
MREPGLFWWPGRIAPGVIRDIGSTLDLFPTIVKLAGGEVPADRPIDGYDLAPVLFGKEPSPRQEMFYWRGSELFAVRKGPWKAHYITQAAYGKDMTRTPHEPPLLYNLLIDPSERFDVAEKNAGVVEDLKKLVETHLKTVTPVENQLEK